jgi:hypothetical protein
MIVGTPGTGIGGLFYLLLAGWMPVRFAGQLLRGRALPGAWKIVVSSITQGSAMIGALWGESWVIQNHVSPWLMRIAAHSPTGTSAAKARFAAEVAAAAPALALLPLLVLAFVLLTVQVARMLGLSHRGPRAAVMSVAVAPAPACAATPAVVTVEER